MKKTGAIALGAIWGIFGMLFGIVVLIILFLGQDAFYSLGDLAMFGVCLFSSADISGFTAAAYIIAIGGFALIILGMIGFSISRRHNIAGGTLTLISVIGVFFLYYLPLTFTYSGGVLAHIRDARTTEQIIVVAAALLSLLVTMLGLIGSILAFLPGKARYAQYGAYAQPFQPPYGQQSQQPYAYPYGQPQQIYGQPQQYGQPYQPYAQPQQAQPSAAADARPQPDSPEQPQQKED